MTQMLIEEAKTGGGGDNITLALAAVEEAGKPSISSIRGAVKQANKQLTVLLEPEA